MAVASPTIAGADDPTIAAAGGPTTATTLPLAAITATTAADTPIMIGAPTFPRKP